MNQTKRSTSVVRNKQQLLKRLCLLMLPAFLVISGIVITSSSTYANTLNWVEGQILIKPAAGINEAALDNILTANKGKAVGKIQHIGVHIVSVPEKAEQKVVDALSKNPNIEFAELNMLVPLSATYPTDPYYWRQWHLPQINTPDAWDVSLGDSIIAAIIDTGVYADHPDLKSLITNGFNTVDNNTDTADIHGHGTAVAGTVAATSNDIGIVGVTWNTNIMPIRVSTRSDGVAQWSDLAEGITWAANNGARVANVSYFVSHSSTISNAAAYMRSKGGVVVSSAGNSGSEVNVSDNINIITVSATEKNDALTSWSSYGDVVDITAPGYYIYTTNNRGSYSSWNGTSFSSPVVAGVAALVMSANPDLTPAEVESLLESTAKDLGSAGWDKKYGHGRVDAGAAVLAAINGQIDPPSPPPPEEDTTPPSVSFVLASNTTVSSTQNIDIDASDQGGIAQVELFIDGNQFGTDTDSPYRFVWDTTKHTHGSQVTLTALATDIAGNSASTSIVVIIDNPPPTNDTEAPNVRIISPENSSTVKRMVKIEISATDNSGQISTISCYIDGQLVKVDDSGKSSMTCHWNSSRASKGRHQIAAKAEDGSGNSANVTIEVFVQ